MKIEDLISASAVIIEGDLLALLGHTWVSCYSSQHIEAGVFGIVLVTNPGGSNLQFAVGYNNGLKQCRFPWEAGYIDKPHLTVRITRMPACNIVCERVVWLLSDPDCHKRLAEKLAKAIGIYRITCQRLPDH